VDYVNVCDYTLSTGEELYTVITKNALDYDVEIFDSVFVPYPSRTSWTTFLVLL
jgi:hypothetical protein